MTIHEAAMEIEIERIPAQLPVIASTLLTTACSSVRHRAFNFVALSQYVAQPEFGLACLKADFGDIFIETLLNLHSVVEVMTLLCDQSDIPPCVCDEPHEGEYWADVRFIVDHVWMKSREYNLSALSMFHHIDWAGWFYKSTDKKAVVDRTKHYRAALSANCINGADKPNAYKAQLLDDTITSIAAEPFYNTEPQPEPKDEPEKEPEVVTHGNLGMVKDELYADEVETLSRECSSYIHDVLDHQVFTERSLKAINAIVKITGKRSRRPREVLTLLIPMFTGTPLGRTVLSLLFTEIKGYLKCGKCMGTASALEDIVIDFYNTYNALVRNVK